MFCNDICVSCDCILSWTQEILVGYVLEELCYRQLFVEWATAATNLPSFADGLNFLWTDIPIFAQGATGKKKQKPVNFWPWPITRMKLTH